MFKNGKGRTRENKNNKASEKTVRIDFSFKREVFFVVVGAIAGAVTFGIADTVFQMLLGLPYYLIWISFGHVVGVYSSTMDSIIAGISIHLITSVSIGIVIGVFLYKTGMLNISKISNGLAYGVFSGAVVFVVFFIPVYEYILSDQIANTIVEINPGMRMIDVREAIEKDFPSVIAGSIAMHLIFGVTVGLISSILSVRFGTRYRCPECNISFRRIDLYQKHRELVHGLSPSQLTRIVVLGGGFGGISVLDKLQKIFQDEIRVDITLISKDNFFLFTPMLPEVSFGSVDTSHILTPIRTFCKRARFYEAVVESVDLDVKKVILSYKIGENDSVEIHNRIVDYDYLVIATGGETNFFGNKEISKYSFTMKTVDDAIRIKNHVIKMLEQADIEHEDKQLTSRLMTFVVVGGGFSGIETVGELNDFVRDSVKEYYHYIDEQDIQIILVNSRDRPLPEVPEDLSRFTLEKLRQNKITVLLNSRVSNVTHNSVILKDGNIMYTHTIIWTGGVKPGDLIENIKKCDHDSRSGKIITDEYLRIRGWDNIFAIGDCAYIMESNTKKPYPPTAQNAIAQAKIATENIISDINQKVLKVNRSKNNSSSQMLKYKTKGVMALIGKRNGVGVLFGIKIHGIIAWMLWRLYYLGNLPTLEKKIRVLLDWTIDMLFKRDVSRF
ncbi:MAG: NAD(P)/FAD-dependent oxidoreductase [Candidatus Nitrosocosmicus sp.]|nr:NAD(P)/FAD-dependent oxidoreductase [Candidatus Nitrosocosmicus sp.]